MSRVFIGIPTRGADIHHDTLIWILKTCHRHPEYNVGAGVCGVSAELAVTALWDIVKPNMLKGDYTHYLQLDSDIIPPPNALDSMLSRNKDIVCAPIWHYDSISKDIHINVHYKDDAHRRHFCKGGGIEEINSSSLGLVLLSKKVFEVFDKANENPVKISPLVTVEECMDSVHNDTIFFAKARKLGLKAYIDWDVKDVVHMRKIDLCTEVLNKFVYCISKGDKFEDSAVGK